MSNNILNVRPGDVFCSSNPWVIGRAIQFAEKFWSKDNKAEYGHGGIIVDKKGKTLEALWKVKFSSLDKYDGCPVLIVRPIKTLNNNTIKVHNIVAALNYVIEKQLNRRYPIHRLLLHLLPPTAKLGTGNYVVCTELVSMYLCQIKILSSYLGINPDDLAEYFIRWNNFKVLFKGIYKKGMCDTEA